MLKKITTITIIIMSILLVSLYVISSTYSLIIDVTGKDNITLKDLLIDREGVYNQTYYNVLHELAIDEKEANILMESIPLNEALNTIYNKEKITNGELYNLIVTALNSDNNIKIYLKNKVINKSSEYLDEISIYLNNIIAQKKKN